MKTTRRASALGSLCSAVFALALLLGGGAVAAAQTPEPQRAFNPDELRVGLEPVAKGLNQPLGAVAANDGSDRLFIVEKGGAIRIFARGALVDQPFLNITDKVDSSGSEQGLLGLAFAPDYARSGLFYVDYIDKDGNTVVARYKVTEDANVADPDSEEVILRQDQPYPNHNGGQLAFGPDGYLYISFGDGGSEGDPQGNGQKHGTWLGKILRIDVDPAHKPADAAYAVPKDNPFVGKDDFKPEIWAYGLRNPWRFSFDKQTGDLYIADVGQNTIEEIDFQPAKDKGGENYGWSIMEGTDCYQAASCDKSGLTMPVAEYTHQKGGCSVTGGFVYRGGQFPTLQGIYFFADYCSGKLWGLGRAADGTWVKSAPTETNAAVSSFGEDEQGELYVCDLNAGILYHLVTTSPQS